MFDPISARFASWFSRNGISEAAADRRGVGDKDLVGDSTVLHLAIRRLDKPELVDARVARQRRDQADVRTFGRFNRANASVVRWMDVADFESGALTRQTTGSERGETPL